jgi:uncharacterized protein (TIGR02996 family)
MRQDDKGDDRQLLLDAWRRLRHPRLAHLVDALDARAGVVVPRVTSTKKRSDAKAWAERDKKGDPRDIHHLVATAGSGLPEDIVAQMDALSKRDEPCLATGYLAMLEAPAYAGVKTRNVLAAMLAALERTRDRRAAAPAKELARRYLKIVDSGTGGYVTEELLAIAARLEALPEQPLEPELEKRCAVLETLLGTRYRPPAPTRDLAPLLAAVFAAPDDDAPRLVLADALQEQGDVRGEFIHLQILIARGEATKEQRAREETLRQDRASLTVWAHPLSNAGECHHGFERGFPAKVRLYTKPAAPRVLEDPAWATVTELSGVDGLSKKVGLQLLTQPALRSVRSLWVPWKILSELPRPWPYTTLNISELPANFSPDTFRPTERLTSLTLSGRYAGLPEGFFALVPGLLELVLTGDVALQGNALAPLLSLRTLELELPREQGPLAWPRALEVLKLRARSLDHVGVGALPHVRELSLKLSSLKGLPRAIAAMPSLEYLEVREHDYYGTVGGSFQYYGEVPTIAKYGWVKTLTYGSKDHEKQGIKRLQVSYRRFEDHPQRKALREPQVEIEELVAAFAARGGAEVEMKRW